VRSTNLAVRFEHVECNFQVFKIIFYAAVSPHLKHGPRLPMQRSYPSTTHCNELSNLCYLDTMTNYVEKATVGPTRFRRCPRCTNHDVSP
jgi:hypothetical protein